MGADSLIVSIHRDDTLVTRRGGRRIIFKATIITVKHISLPPVPGSFRNAFSDLVGTGVHLF